MFVIVGHSERRDLYGETDEIVNTKIKVSLKNELKVIFCIGEQLETREKGEAESFCAEQIEKGLQGISVEDVENVIIAYEPVWSVGTNKLPSIEELTKTISYIKELVYSMCKSNIKVIYGGSINERNIENFNKIKELGGFLIGSASINPNQFIEIIEKIS